jgi:hypothetical protein
MILLATVGATAVLVYGVVYLALPQAAPERAIIVSLAASIRRRGVTLRP